MRLAIHLLDGIAKGGYAFVGRMKCKARCPKALAKLVLEEWIKKKPMGATKAKLYDVLAMEKVNPAAAYNFKSALTGKTELLHKLTNVLSHYKKIRKSSFVF